MRINLQKLHSARVHFVCSSVAVWKGEYHHQAVAVKMLHSNRTSTSVSMSMSMSADDMCARINNGTLDDVLECGNSSSAAMEGFLAEASLLATLRHFNIVNFL